jgi:hypothetical protein
MKKNILRACLKLSDWSEKSFFYKFGDKKLFSIEQLVLAPMQENNRLNL